MINESLFFWSGAAYYLLGIVWQFVEAQWRGYPLYSFDLRAMASVSFGFVLVRVRVQWRANLNQSHHFFFLVLKEFSFHLKKSFDEAPLLKVTNCAWHPTGLHIRR
jgi:hypothetical protein